MKERDRRELVRRSRVLRALCFLPLLLLCSRAERCGYLGLVPFDLLGIDAAFGEDLALSFAVVVIDHVRGEITRVFRLDRDDRCLKHFAGGRIHADLARSGAGWCRQDLDLVFAERRASGPDRRAFRDRSLCCGSGHRAS